jgi:hypothetical protein
VSDGVHELLHHSSALLLQEQEQEQKEEHDDTSEYDRGSGASLLPPATPPTTPTASGVHVSADSSVLRCAQTPSIVGLLPKPAPPLPPPKVRARIEMGLLPKNVRVDDSAEIGVLRVGEGVDSDASPFAAVALTSIVFETSGACGQCSLCRLCR